MFRICLCFVIFLVALADDTNMQAKAKQLEDVFKSNLSPEQKKAKFNEFLTSLGGDYKAKFDSLINELKTKLASSSNEKVKNLGNKLLSQFEAGAFFSGMENARTMITKEIADAKLSEADRAEMKTLKEEFGQKFHSMFQGVLPKENPTSST
ncbi:hypothetical protein GCK32_013996 [Trichostrongylus colubriformis]|uniref:Uncharacterized protein n=1 Tax=Trichostrongylus colubriformis TaxID=6319 RepID=A0AAN8IRQ5_TRICO